MKFADGWMSPENKNEVIILYIEDHTNGRHDELYDELDEILGGKFYASSGECESRLDDNVSKADVLNAGKQVVLRMFGCSDNTGLRNIAHRRLGGIERIAEDGTAIGAVLGEEAITKAQVTSSFRDDGVNIVNLDNFTYTDGRIAAGIWSWAPTQPNSWGGNQDCASQSAEKGHGGGRWDDIDCGKTHYFACQDDNGDWALSFYAGKWDQGEAACKELGDHYNFDVPINSAENEALKLVRQAAAQDRIWLNYHDRNVEGRWESPEYEPVGINTWRTLIDQRTGKCLDIKGGSSSNGANVQLYRCHGNDNQLWRYDVNTMQIRSRKSGKCLDIPGDDNKVNRGANIQIWGCQAHARDQRWIIDGASFRNVENRDLVIDAFGEDNGDNIGLWTHHGKANQRWTWGEPQ